jgi:hypothetical protein
LKPEKVKEILAETTRVWIQVGLLLNVRRLTHDQGIQVFRVALKQGGPLGIEIIMSRILQAIPEKWHKTSVLVISSTVSWKKCQLGRSGEWF